MPPEPVDTSGVQKVIADIYERETDKADQIAVTEADAQLSALETELLYNPQTGALNRRGKDAFGLPEEVNTAWAKRVGEIERGLTSDRQRLRFQQMAQGRSADVDRTLQRHVAGEIQSHDRQVTDALLAGERNAAIANYTDPERVGLSLTRQVAAIREFGQRNGLAPEVIDSVVAKETSSTHVAILNRMLAAGSDQLALTYLNANRAGIAGEDIADVERKVQVISSESEGARGADAIWREMGPKTLNDPVKLATLEQAVRDRYGDNQQIIKAAIGQLRTRAEAFNSEQREVGASNKATVLGAYNEGRSLSQIIRMPEYLALPGDEQNSIRTYIVDRGYSLQQRANADTPSARNYTKYWEVSNPQRLNGMSESEIIALEPEVGRTLVTDLLNKKRSLGRSEMNVRTATIDADTFNTVAASAGFDPYKKNIPAKEKARLGQLRSRVETEIERVQQGTNRELTRDEKQSLMQSIVDETVMLDRSGRDREVRAVQVTDDQRGRTYVPWTEIPADKQQEIARALRDLAGRVPSRGQVQRAYAAWLLDDTARFRAIATEGQ